MDTYEPKPIDTADIVLPESVQPLVEHLAEHNHDIWSQQRLIDGWTWGPTRDDAAKTNPCLVAYADLPDTEKQYDRNAAIETLKAIPRGQGVCVRRLYKAKA